MEKNMEHEMAPGFRVTGAEDASRQLLAVWRRGKLILGVWSNGSGNTQLSS